MIVFPKLFALVVAAAFVPQATLAQEGNAKMGQLIAEEYCVECHDVEKGGAFKEDPPSFAAIAKYRSRDQIVARINEPIHGKMPRYKDYMIGGNIPDMVAYIASLED